MPVVFDGIFNPQEPEIYYHMYSVTNIIILLHRDVVDDMMYQTLFTHMLMLMLMLILMLMLMLMLMLKGKN